MKLMTLLAALISTPLMSHASVSSCWSIEKAALQDRIELVQNAYAKGEISRNSYIRHLNSTLSQIYAVAVSCQVSDRERTVVTEMVALADEIRALKAE